MTRFDDDDDGAGYGRPPKKHRFKPGQSGNPRGRPLKAPRADVPSQVGRDFRAMGNRTIRTAEGEISLIEAVVRAMFQAALKGNVRAGYLVLEFFRRGCQENIDRNAALKLLEELNLDQVNRRPRTKKRMNRVVKDLAKRSKKS